MFHLEKFASKEFPLYTNVVSGVFRERSCLTILLINDIGMWKVCYKFFNIVPNEGRSPSHRSVGSLSSVATPLHNARYTHCP